MFGVDLYEILTILMLIIIFLGANRLPEIGRRLSDAIREKRKKDFREEVIEEGKDIL